MYNYHSEPMPVPKESLAFAESIRLNISNVLKATDDKDILRKYRIMFRKFNQSDTKQLLKYFPQTLETFNNYESFQIDHSNKNTLTNFAEALFNIINHEILIMKKCLNFDAAVDIHEANLHNFYSVPYDPIYAYCRGGSDEAFMEYDRFAHEQQFTTNPHENPGDVLEQNARQMRMILGNEEYNRRLQMFSAQFQD